MNKEYYIKLSARIDDSQKTTTELNKQIKDMETKLQKLELKVDAKGIKAATSTFIPVVGKALGESVDMVIRSDNTPKKFYWNCRNDYNNRNMCYAYNKTNNINISFSITNHSYSSPSFCLVVILFLDCFFEKTFLI